jgi:hypothetical protein
MKPQTDYYDVFREYSIEYRYHFEGTRQIVEEIVAYFIVPDRDPNYNRTSYGQQITAKELSEMGFIVWDELKLQQVLDEEWEDQQRETASDYIRERYQ